MKGMTLRELVDRVGGEILGDDAKIIRGVAPIEASKPGDITFLANPGYARYVEGCEASALITQRGADLPFRPLVYAENPYHLFAKVVGLFHEPARPAGDGIDPNAVISPEAVVGDGCAVMTGAVVEAGAVIGKGCVLYPGVYVREGAVLGENCMLHPRVIIEAGCRIGARVILHGGTIIGEPGDMDLEDPTKGLLPTGVEIGDDVELGGNVTVSRGGRRPTKIGAGTKMDNLVHLDSGVEIGKHCILVAQSRIGENVFIDDLTTIAGQCSVEAGVRIGKKAVVAARSVVVDDIPDGAVYSGAPARPHSEEKRIVACLNRLPTLFQRVRELEQKLGNTENGQ